MVRFLHILFVKKNMRTTIILMSTLTTILFSCSCNKNANSQSNESSVTITASSDLVGKWKLIELNGKKNSNASYYIQFLDQERYGAFAGCNRLGGAYKLEGSKVFFSKGVSTLMACPDDGLERELSLFLDGEKTYAKTDKTLVISNSKNVVEAKFELFK
ncbi:hypothetical protein GCM10028861_28390 [Flavobacterium koreense]